uniref:Uncharacterized protein n=1 Tax=Cacopsylla melanoneura TaxID=428564 RepID=A0A8D9DWG4_9HEMI
MSFECIDPPLEQTLVAEGINIPLEQNLVDMFSSEGLDIPLEQIQVDMVSSEGLDLPLEQTLASSNLNTGMSSGSDLPMNSDELLKWSAVYHADQEEEEEEEEVYGWP